MSRIPVNEIEYYGPTGRDLIGRAFFWNGRVFRGFSADRWNNFRRIFESGAIDELMHRKMLVESKISDYSIDEFEVLLEHKRIEFITYPYEWTFEMIKSAGVLEIDIETILSEYDLSLTSANLFNVLFEGPKPVHIDITSMGPYDKNGSTFPAYGDILKSCIEPLDRYREKKGAIARMELKGKGLSTFQAEKGDQRSWAKGLGSAASKLPSSIKAPIRHHLSNVHHLKNTSPDRRKASLGRIKRIIQSKRLPPEYGAFSNYYKTSWAKYHSHSDPSEWPLKNQSFTKMLSMLKPGTLLDNGSNKGWYSRQA